MAIDNSFPTGFPRSSLAPLPNPFYTHQPGWFFKNAILIMLFTCIKSWTSHSFRNLKILNISSKTLMFQVLLCFASSIPSHSPLPLGALTSPALAQAPSLAWDLCKCSSSCLGLSPPLPGSPPGCLTHVPCCNLEDHFFKEGALSSPKVSSLLPAFSQGYSPALIALFKAVTLCWVWCRHR